MASSRTERIGTIFSRVSSLIDKGAMKKENIPVWYNIYKAFPPKYKPSFNRKLPTNEIQQIFYAEDNIRVKFQKDAFLPAMDLTSDKISRTQIFFTLHEALQQDTDENVYEKAFQSYKNLFEDH